MTVTWSSKASTMRSVSMLIMTKMITWWCCWLATTDYDDDARDSGRQSEADSYMGALVCIVCLRVSCVLSGIRDRSQGMGASRHVLRTTPVS
eukprot:26706-Eustigmatos_ZCMA.PRE.1